MRNSAPTPSGQKPIVMHASDALTPDIHPHESRKTLIIYNKDEDIRALAFVVARVANSQFIKV
jgi:hypothetical protein